MINDNSLEYTIAKTLFKYYGIFENSNKMLPVEKSPQKGEELPDIKLHDLRAPGLNGSDFTKYFQPEKKRPLKPVPIDRPWSSVNPDHQALIKHYPFLKSFWLNTKT
ncbi:hypothetical protein [Mucilaginibacter lappiensis]|jgi:hypothetical protein|uniref:hypothetical protein n=1 Tax=Mucilaginibacter lappiensis TaxID=354630 RepID=UPI003D1BF5DF